MMPPLPRDLRDIQANPRHCRHAQRLLGSASTWNKDAGRMVRYLGEFLTLSCAPDLLALRLFPNAKEITESFAAYEAARRRLHPHWNLGDPTITCVVVGDGHTPRTAATFAFRTAWQCHSVDPLLRGGTQRWSAIERLTLHRCKAAAVEPILADRALVVAVHSHAKLPEAIATVQARELAVIAIPCCVTQELPQEPDWEYEDRSVLSPCRTVKVWRNRNGHE
jgi:hypothetical protein